jgi:hypothetical protein
VFADLAPAEAISVLKEDKWALIILFASVLSFSPPKEIVNPGAIVVETGGAIKLISAVIYDFCKFLL